MAARAPGCLLETMLFSLDFQAVNAPMSNAVALFYTLHRGDRVVPPFIEPACESVKTSQELNLKRALWLILMRMQPAISQYVVSHAAWPERAAALAVWLETDVERLFTGGYAAYEYPLDELAAAAQVFYNSYV